jgi:PAS domain S-box-containing protein
MPDRTVSFNLIPNAIFTVDRSGIIRQVNSQLTAMFGYRAEELIGQPIEILLPERARQRHVHHRTAFQLNPTMRPMGGGPELCGCRKDGSEFPVDIMLNSLSAAEDFSAVVRDTTNKVLSGSCGNSLIRSLTGLPNVRPSCDSRNLSKANEH